MNNNANASSERSDIIAEMVNLRASINRKKRSITRSDDAGYNSIVSRSIVLDEQKFEDLQIHLLDFPK